MKKTEEIIASRQNRRVVELCKLTDRKAREATRKFRFDGVKLLEEAIKNELAPDSIFLRAAEAERLYERYLKPLEACGFWDSVSVFVLTDELFDKISEEKSPEGVICCAKYIDKFQKNITIYNSADFSRMENERIVLLESVRDPSNIGAVIRSAAALGVDRLIISSDCADIYHPRAVRASMGTLFNQPIDRVDDLPGVVAGLRESGRRVFAAALNTRAERLGSFPILRGDCVVIGNEGHGLTDATVAACTGSVLIPMSDRAESFNAAVAASILMWEFSRKAEN
ncbi:MAG: RNA methyltransferase [Ruminococcaceae bacterium]|nr:RNA methyltransferase [Oscillospiraceae bacterium]